MPGCHFRLPIFGSHFRLACSKFTWTVRYFDDLRGLDLARCGLGPTRSRSQIAIGDCGMASYSCSSCGHSFSVPDWLDTVVKCPKCGIPATKLTTTSAPAAGTTGQAAIAPSSSTSTARPAPRDSGHVASAQPASAVDGGPAMPTGQAAAASPPSQTHGQTARRPWPKLHLPGLRWLLRRNKFVVFGLIGALGCCLGALVGEVFLTLTKVAPPAQEASGTEKPPPQAVSLVIDCSGSMSGEWLGLKGLVGLPTKLSEVKSAAKTFAQAQAATPNEIGVIGFGGTVHVGAELTRDPGRIEAGINGLSDGGWTAMAEALNAATSQLESATLARNALLFTDGMPEYPGKSDDASRTATLAAARACRGKGIRIIAIATGDADLQFLKEVTGDPSLVIPVSAGNFGQGFSAAAQKIYGRSLVESGPTPDSFVRKTLRVGGWTSLLALGLSLALIGGQNIYLRRRFLTLRQGCPVTFAAIIAGFVAGAAGQLIFSPFSAISLLQSLGTIVGWSVLGALVGRGMAWFVPNLAPRRARIGGTIGGAIAAIAFLYVSTATVDILGRLIGAAILGLAIGLLIAFIEAKFRELWLQITYGPREEATVNLGSDPVTIGSDSRQCTVFAMGVAPVALRYRAVGSTVQCEDVPANRTTTAQPGDSRTVGNLTVTICGSNN